MKAWELIKALEEGKRIMLDLSIVYPYSYGNYEKGEMVQKFWQEKKELLGRGFNTHKLRTDELLLGIWRNPEHYQIEEIPVNNLNK